MILPASGDTRRDLIRGVAFALFFFSASVFLPIVGFFFALFIPVPILFYRVKRGRRNGAIIAGASGGLMLLLLAGGPSGDGLFFFGLLLLGLALGEGLDQGLPVERTVLYACGAVLGCATVLLLFHTSLSGVNLVPFLSDYIRQNLELSIALYQQMGVPPAQLDAIRNLLDLIHQTLLRLLPALVVSATLMVAWTTLLLGLSLLRVRAVPVTDPGPLNRWRVPEPLIWGVIGCGGLLLLPDTGLRLVGINGLIVLLTVYFFGGIAVVSFFFQKRRLPLALRFLFYALIAIQQLLVLIVVAIGLFDMWFNFRKLDVNEGED